MTEESGVSRTPRTWIEGSEEPPEDVTLLYRDDGCGYVKRVPSGGWWYVEFPSSSIVGAKGWAWKRAQGWPLVEVLPDAPEPQPEEWRVNARIEEARATSLGYCEHVVEVYPDGEEETCGNLRERGSVHCAEHGVPAPEFAAGVSSVSPEGETTPGEGEAARGELRPLSEEDEYDVQTALRAVEADNAGHWPTVASVLAAEVLRLRGGALSGVELRDAEERDGEVQP